MIADQLSRTVHFDENYLFILSNVTNINIKHNHKQWKLMHEQQILIWTGEYTITDKTHKIILEIHNWRFWHDKGMQGYMIPGIIISW